MQTIIPTEIYDESENLLRIEFYDLEANFIFRWNGMRPTNHHQKIRKLLEKSLTR